jgi:hypothetical protein
MQEVRVISCPSRQLRRHEEHYHTHDRALAAVVMALRTWRHYLLGNVVHLYGPQKLKVHFYPIRFEHETVKVAQIDQRL